MAIGERIHHFRLLRGFTQKIFRATTRIQRNHRLMSVLHSMKKRCPQSKENYLNALADIFDVSPHATGLSPDIDSYVGLCIPYLH